MTGIAGTVGREPADRTVLLGAMARALSVAPDALTERWADSHAALCRVRNPAIDAGGQPVLSADGRRCLFFFGECFGWADSRRELQRLGHRFGDQPSDAEYVMRLHEQHGDAAFGLLNGSFCCALYDSADRSLRLASDRLGSRPLFYGTAAGGGLSFASRVSPLLADPAIGADLDVDAVVEFCTLQKVLGDKTYHRGVRMLPPASLLVFRDGSTAVSRYWTPRYRPQAGDLDHWADELAATMRSAMAEVTRGPGPTGILLSGGLDGRMMVAAAGEPLACYCFGDYENPEFEVARQVARARGFEIHFLRRDPDHYPDLLDRAVELGSGMHPFNHAHALGFVERIAARTPVLTHGYGVEALFRGTTLPKVPRRFLGLPAGTRLDPSLDERTLAARYYRRAYSLIGQYPDLFADGIAAGIEASIEASAREVIADAAPHCASVYDRLLWSDVFARCRYTGYLFLLSLRPYVTERSVLFDNRVIDLHLRMPVEMRADDRLWIRAMARLDRRVAAVVNANTGFAPGTPAWRMAAARAARSVVRTLPLPHRAASSAGEAAAAGLSPISWARFEWLIRHNEKLRGLITATLADPRALPARIFNRERVAQLLDEHLAGRGRHRDLLFALLTFGRWHRSHAVDG